MKDFVAMHVIEGNAQLQQPSPQGDFAEGFVLPLPLLDELPEVPPCRKAPFKTAEI